MKKLLCEKQCATLCNLVLDDILEIFLKLHFIHIDGLGTDFNASKHVITLAS